MSQTSLPVQPVDEAATSSGGAVRGRIVLTVVLVALAVLACRDAWLDILQIVRVDEEASHILLVPLVFARIAWVRRTELTGWKPTVSYWGPAIVLAGVACWLYGNISAIQVLWHFGAILSMVGAFVCINGVSVVRRLWPAFLVLLFLMPMPGTIRHPLALFLQNASAQATEVVIVALGFELVRHTNLLIINDYPVGIAEACNGMRMVSMLLLVVFAFVFSEKVRPWVRIFLIFLATPLAILCNIIRLVPTVLAYGFFNPELADQLHTWLGWVMVVVSYFMLMGLLWLMRWLLLPVDPKTSLSRPRPFRKRRLLWPQAEAGEDQRPKKPWQVGASVAALMIVLGSAYAVGQSLPDGSDAAAYHERVLAVADELPRQVDGWASVDTELPEAAVALLRPNVLISRRYEEEATGRSFALLVVQCADARDMEGHYPPNCYPTSGWTSMGQSPVDLSIGEFQAGSMDYRYQRRLQHGIESIDVVNLIALPEGGFVTSMRSIRKLSGTVTDRYYGAAQVQFVFDDRWEKEERLAVVEQVGATLEPLIRVILDKEGKQG